MKKFLILTAMMWATAIIFAAPVAAQNKQTKTNAPKTVTEFYLKLPAKYLQILEAIPNRRSLIKTEDTANGYLRLESKDWEGWGEVALFKRANGSYVVAVTEYSCAPVCDGNLTFLDYKNGKWKEIELLPRYTVGDLRTAFHGATGRQPDEDEMNEQVFELPRKGKEITLKIGGVPVLGFLWQSDEFVSGMIYLRDGGDKTNQK
ncbi:MAG: hypothetical protein ACR2MG_07065 [Pyrinomonadaceae bacterium]